MAEYIEGKRAVLEAFKTNVPATCLYVAEGSHGDKNVSELVKRAHKMGLSVKQVKRDQLDKRSERGSHQGVMLETKPFEYCSAQALINGALAHAEQNNGNALIVVLDHITDAGNLGAIARSAEVVGASGVVIPNKRSAHVNAATYKSSAGAIAHLPIAQVANIAQFIDRLKKSGFWVAGASEKAPQCIWDAPMAGKLALVMGNEGTGLA